MDYNNTGYDDISKETESLKYCVFRQRRRQIKLQKPANRKARKAKEGRSAQKDSGQSGETEGEQSEASEAEVSQEDEISQVWTPTLTV